jgi:hypothetical protein
MRHDCQREHQARNGSPVESGKPVAGKPFDQVFYQALWLFSMCGHSGRSRLSAKA